MNRPRLGPISTGLYYRKISPKCKSFYCVHQPESGKASENDACLQASSHPVYPRTHAGSICCNHEALPETVPIGDSLTRSDDSLDHLLVRNKQWAQRLTTWNPTFFTDLSRQQSPELLWLGCSDSRVPANQIIDLLPGQVFVHRNIANIVHTTDMNCLAVLQFAVTVLKVKHIIVCGHYGCGGILAAMDKNTSCGVILDQWLEQVKEMLVLNKPQIDALPTNERADFLTELNVQNSVNKVAATTVLQEAWARGQRVTLHGWCYRLTDGHIKDLKITRKGHVK